MQQQEPTVHEPNTTDIPTFNGLDTIYHVKRAEILEELSSAPDVIKDADSTTYFFYKAYKNILSVGEADSATYYLSKIEPKGHTELENLIRIITLNKKLNGTVVVTSELFDDIIQSLKKSEANNSKYSYKYYEILAQTSYYLDKFLNAKEYADEWFNLHPYNHSTFVRQHYFDMSFLFAEREKDVKGMQQSVDSSLRLATFLKDSVAIMRTKEYQAQINILQKDYEKAKENTKSNIEFATRRNILKAQNLKNLANIYNYQKQYDSVIYYNLKAIEFAKQHDTNAYVLHVYEALKGAYQAKGDYKTAFYYYDTTAKMQADHNEKIQLNKIAEIRTQYETEEKDRTIDLLKETNLLIQKNQTQKNWIFGIVSIALIFFIAFLIIYFRQKILRSTNEKLQSENKKLILEQKVNQIQLNPHFIYNAIANMQGLINSGKNKESNSYLVALSKYIRNTLELNREDYITLKEEIDNLKNYLHLQQMRFPNAFNFEVVASNVNEYATLIPPMLLQPFIENAIDHGFHNIDYMGELTIQFTAIDNVLHIEIKDNGLGVNNGKKNNKKSLSTKIIQERINLLYNQDGKENGKMTSQAYTHNNQTGYIVTIEIPLLNE